MYGWKFKPKFDDISTLTELKGLFLSTSAKPMCCKRHFRDLNEVVLDGSTVCNKCGFILPGMPFTHAAWLVDSASTEYDTGLYVLLYGYAVIPTVNVYINPIIPVFIFSRLRASDTIKLNFVLGILL